MGVLRNGAAADVVRTSRESSIAAKYFFGGVRHSQALLGNPAAFSAPCPNALVLEAQIRSAFATIVEASVDDGAAAHAAAAGANDPPFDRDAARTTARANAGNRVEAIGLGAGHASLVVSYEITEVDLRATEANPAILELDPPGAAANAGAYNTSVRTATAGWSVVMASGNAVGDLTPVELTVMNMAALTAIEVELAYAMLSIGQAAPVRAGAQLFTDGHHYHSDVGASSRHRAIEKEVIGRAGTEATNMWKSNLMALRNVIWHAAPHSVSGLVLQALGEDDEMPARLDATGFGSMSVGLPAQEDLFNRAGSYTAVRDQVFQTATAHGHKVSIAQMTATVTALSNLPRRGALVGNRPELPELPAGAWPAGCNTRPKALKLYLEPALDKAEPVAAWMFALYKEICARGGVRINSVEGSLLRSHSLKRAHANFLGEANRAVEMYVARARFIRAEAEEGRLEHYEGSA